MAITDFINEYKIDVRAFERIRRRVMIVGRFSLDKKKGDPEVFLFSNRPAGQLSAEYRDNFTGTFDISYDSFVDAVRPRICDKIEMNGPLPMVYQVLASSERAEEGASVMSESNYFFERGIATSTQEAFRQDTRKLRGEKEILGEADPTPGKRVFQQVQGNLATFCKFQPRTYEVVEAFAKLLEQCAVEKNLPQFAHGDPLPPGFPEKLIEYLYDETTSRGFDLEGVDLSAEPWHRLERSPSGKEELCTLVGAFRQALVDASRDDTAMLKYKGRPVRELADSAIEEVGGPTRSSPVHLRAAFMESRTAYNSLRQILRSRALLSMVLEWLLREYYKLDSVVAKGTNAEKDRAVGDAILRESDRNDLAAPILRPSKEERKRFRDLLKDQFAQLVGAIVGGKSSAAYGALPNDLKSVADERIKDRPTTAFLAEMCKDKDQKAAFLGAGKVTLADVLCPALYQEPILNVIALKRLMTKASMEAFLSAIFLTNENQAAVQEIADKHLQYFTEQIDRASQELRNKDSVTSRLLKDYLKLMTNKENVRRFREGNQVLLEVNEQLQRANLHESLGISVMVPIRADQIELAKEGEGSPGSLDETPTSKVERVTIVTTAAREGLKRASAAGASISAERTAGVASESPSTTGGGNDERSSEVASATATATEAQESPQEPLNFLDIKVDDLIKQFKRELGASEPTAQQLKDIERRVGDTLINDADVMGELDRKLSAYERMMFLIYKRYAKNPHLKEFQRRVERMTLANMMLVFQRDLGLGKVFSSLYQLLLDMVLHVDSETSDLREFMEYHSLTSYFDGAVLDGNGITALRQTLDVQAGKSLRNIVALVSELWGVKYLMERARGSGDVELIVMNATAAEFLQWLRQDNLTSGVGRGRFQPGKLIAGGSEVATVPAVVYLTDLAFADGASDKASWLRQLSDFPLQNDALTCLMPPLCISTASQKSDDGFAAEGEALRKASESCPTPVLILGPSANLNSHDDVFPTVLPAGYLFAAHLLASPAQSIRFRSISQSSKGRFRIIGQAAQLQDDLSRVLMGQEDANRQGYGFAGDYYLFLVLALLAAAKGGGRSNRAVSREDLEPFFFRVGNISRRAQFEETSILNGCVFGGNALRFSLNFAEKDDAPASLTGVNISIGDELTKPKANAIENADHAWFMRATAAMKLIQV
jgi:hypothetical protein